MFQVVDEDIFRLRKGAQRLWSRYLRRSRGYGRCCCLVVNEESHVRRLGTVGVALRLGSEGGKEKVVEKVCVLSYAAGLIDGASEDI